MCYTFCPGWRGEGDAVRVAAPSVRQENGRGYGSGGGHRRACFREGTEGIAPRPPSLAPPRRRAMTLDAGAERMIFVRHNAQSFFTKKSLNSIFANVNL